VNKAPIVCIAGKNEIAVFGLHLLVKTIGRENVRVCLNSDDNDHPSWQPSLSRHADELGVQINDLSDLYSQAGLIFLSLEFDKIINPSKFVSDQLFNIHFSMLPAYKGMYTSYWPILNGEKFSGITLHKIDLGIDTGNIISQIKINLKDEMTSRDLYVRSLQESKMLLKQNLNSILNQTYTEKKQQTRDSTYFSKKSVDFSSLSIDFKQTAQSVCNHVKAYHFREYQTPYIDGYKIINGILLKKKSSKKPGQYSVHNDYLILSTIDYDVKFQIDRSMEIFQHIDDMEVEKIYTLSESKSFDINITNKKGWSPLMVASFEGKLLCCKTLIILGANLDQSNPNGTTPFMYSMSHAKNSGNFEVAKLLIKEGCVTDALDMFDLSAIDYAKKNSDNDIIKFLTGL
tara:strand:+ start:1004 stop:2206 length:1203 start_codon:yes stop_codon:yes gene_type:complete